MANRLVRNFRFMSAAVVGVAAVQFVLYFVVARYLGTYDYGSFAVALTMALLAAPLCDLGMNISVVWSHSRDPDRLAEIVGASLLIRLLLALPVGAAAYGIGHLIGFDSGVLWLFAPLFLAALLDGISGLFSAVFQAKELMGWSSTILLGRNVARASGLGMTLLVDGDLSTLALMWLAASAANAVFSGALASRFAGIRLRREAMAPVLRDALPFGSAIIANLLLMQSDILMIGHFAGEDSVGVYHVAFRFIVLAELLPQIISMVIIPRSYRIGHLEGAASLSRFYRVQTLVLGTVGLLGSLMVALHGSVLTTLVLGAEFIQSGALLTALAPMIFLRFLAVPLGDALSSLGYQNRLSRATWMALGCNLVLNFILIPRCGALGAAIATCCSQVGMMAALTLFARDIGLDGRWERLLAQPLAVASIVAIAFAALPSITLWLIPLAIVLLGVLAHLAPTDEHRSVLRAAGIGAVRQPENP